MLNNWTQLVGLAVVLCAMSACESAPAGNRAPVLQVRVVKVYEHDPQAFTQGLIVEGGTLFESTGHYGQSSLRLVDLDSGKVEKQQPLQQQYFAEGITVLNDRVYQLTWKENVCVVYEKSGLRPLGYYNYAGQGWGLTDDERVLFMSDGSNIIRVLDPQFKLQGRLSVREGRRPVKHLNELEFVKGFIYANIWYEDRIAKIDPKNGQVVAWIDCSGVYPANQRGNREHVMNGIAYDAEADRLFITGKNWPNLYEIEVVEQEPANKE